MPDTTGTPAQEPQEPDGQQAPEDTTDPPGDEQGAQKPETFPRDYVQRLRDEAAAQRVKAKRADALAHRLHTALVAATGRLADPTDLPFTEELLDDDGLVDETKVRTAVEDLIKRKPHLAARRPTGDVGQGARSEVPDMGLAAMLRRGA